MELQTVEDKIERFLERKFRASRSYATKRGYKTALNKFLSFVRIKYNRDLNQLLRLVKETKEVEPIDVLDDYYTHLSNFKTGLQERPNLSNSTIRCYILVTKEFLNSEGCHIYNEDLRQKFRLPKKSTVYEKGLTKDTIRRLLRLANPKLATIILMACSGGMRISELVQLRLSDVNLETNPTTITIRKETTKTRQTRITHITSEAKLALQDYLRKYRQWHENDSSVKYLFLQTHEDKINRLRKRLKSDNYESKLFRRKDETRLESLENELKTLGNEELYAKAVITARHSLENQLEKVIGNIPELSTKNDNGRNAIHFHAFRAWFKTQVTNAHQSDFAEALMGHTSLKLVYYRQNDEQRAKIYREIEPALTISDTEKIEKSFEILQEENHDLRKIVDELSIQLKSLEKRIEFS